MVEMLGEHRGGRDDKESEKAAHLLGSLLDEVSIGAEDIRGLVERPECRAEVDHINRMEPKFEGSDHSEVPATAAHRPKQIGILLTVAVTKLPSAKTMSTERRLSIVRPYRRVR